MLESIKRYDVTIKGRIQDRGYRQLIVDHAVLRGLRGFVFNDKDGSVKVICEGDARSTKNFFEEIYIKDAKTDIEVTSIEPKEIPAVFSLPPTFAKLETDSLVDFGRKLDRGIGLLDSMDGKLDKLDSIDNRLATLPGQIATELKSVLGK